MRPLILGAFTLVAVGCGTRGDLYVEKLAPLALVATSSALVQVVPQTNTAVIIPADGTAPQATRISPQARLARALPDGDTVAVLGGAAKSPVLDLVSVSRGSVQTLEVPGPFDALAPSPDGSLLVLSYLATGRVAGLAARNLNEIALVDLGSGSVSRLQLNTESLAPRQVVFTPRTSSRRLVAVGLDRGVAIFDPTRPLAQVRRVALRPSTATQDSAVLELDFSNDGHWLFVRASGIDDVIVIELGEEAGTQELTASVNFVAGGNGLSDIEVPRSDALPNAVLAVYAGSREAVLLDARGLEDNVVRLPLPDPLSAGHFFGNRVLLSDGRYRSVVAWDPLQGLSGVAMLGAGFDAKLEAQELGQTVFAHPSIGAAGSALSVVSIEAQSSRLRVRLQSIQMTAPASAWALDHSGQRLFFAVPKDSMVVRLDLPTMALAQVTLDASISVLLHLPGTDTLAAVHPGNGLGDLTLLLAEQLERTAGRRVRDVALTGELNRPEDEGTP
jgi:hypothetical protein